MISMLAVPTTGNMEEFGLQIASDMAVELDEMEAMLTQEQDMSDSLFKKMREISKGNLALDQSIKTGCSLKGESGQQLFLDLVVENRTRIESVRGLSYRCITRTLP